MKKIMILAAAVLMACLAASAQDGRSIYNKYSGKSGVESVYISPAMFKMIGTLPSIELDSSDVDLAPVIRALNGMYILSSSNAEVNASLPAEVSGFAEKGRMELLMEASDEGETVKMYTSSDRRDSDLINGFLLFVSEPSESTYIYIDGSMSRKDFEALMNASMQ